MEPNRNDGREAKLQVAIRSSNGLDSNWVSKLGMTAIFVTLGITDELDKTGRYNSIRAKLSEMDAKTQNREMQKMGATPEYISGSVHAVTESGRMIIASKTGSQLAG